jgi:O-antigen ligase
MSSLFSSPYPNISGALVIGQASMLALAWILWRSRLSEQEIHLLVRASVLGTGIIMLIGLFTFYRAVGVPTSMISLINAHFLQAFKDSYERVTFGSIGQTNSLSVMVLPLCVCMASSAYIKWKDRWLYGVVGLILAVNLLIAFERWAVVSMLLFLLFFLVRVYRGKRKWLLALLAAAVLAPVIITFNQSVFDERVTTYFKVAATGGGNEGSPLSFRLDVFAEGLRLIEDNPFGIGLGMENLRRELVVTAIHNFFLDNAFEGGVFMLIGLVIWAIWISKRFYYVLKLGERGLHIDIATGLLSGALCFLLKGLFNNNPLYTYATGVWMAYWFSFPLLAMTVVQFHRLSERAGNR